ncbi:MAG: 2-oxoacid:acceptor oxidoreductase subunit alpha [Candidatus Dormibacteraeota bacterium]|nr:2-oxoacid:acceptor oxidoreductase subunit alpha [Candidatus Dormibacteraeota bacterium]
MLQAEIQAATRVNDFAIKLANVNGTGSASANSLLMQAIFRMGVPVSGKNLFPSNIQGLPTWYEIRVNADGHTSRSLEYDLMVAMNGQTYAQDIAEVRSGGYLLFDDSWPLELELRRPDVTFLGVPLARLCADKFASSRERILMKNVAYAGALVALLDLDPELVAQLLTESYGHRQQLLESNQLALRLGYEYARGNFSCPLPCHVERLDKTRDLIMIDGNTATALGALYAGATVAAWYPITPATSVMENFIRLCAKYRREAVPDANPGEPAFRNNYLVVQAEDELAALGVVVGASWAGARAFTSTSGPGLSLMSELLGLAYYTEVPAVVVDVQRAGPSTGMPTRVQQADILMAAYASHGDTKQLLLFPADPGECFHLTVLAFDLAERFQTPVLVLSDLDIGMNDWAVPELTWDDAYVPDRGRVLGEQELQEISEFFRYSDEDQLSVTPRTLPGVSPRGAYFVRGSGHDRLGGYTERPDDYQQVVDRLLAKHRAAADHMPAPVLEQRPGAQVGVITVGSCDLAVREAVQLLSQAGVEASYLRVRGFPFPAQVRQFIDDHEICFVVEQNRDAQLKALIQVETGAPSEKLRSVLVYGGLPLSAREVVAGIKRQLEV